MLEPVSHDACTGFADLSNIAGVLGAARPLVAATSPPAEAHAPTRSATSADYGRLAGAQPLLGRASRGAARLRAAGARRASTPPGWG